MLLLCIVYWRSKFEQFTLVKSRKCTGNSFNLSFVQCICVRVRKFICMWMCMCWTNICLVFKAPTHLARLKSSHKCGARSFTLLLTANSHMVNTYTLNIVHIKEIKIGRKKSNFPFGSNHIKKYHHGISIPNRSIDFSALQTHNVWDVCMCVYMCG